VHGSHVSVTMIDARFQVVDVLHGQKLPSGAADLLLQKATVDAKIDLSKTHMCMKI